MGQPSYTVIPINRYLRHAGETEDTFSTSPPGVYFFISHRAMYCSTNCELGWTEHCNMYWTRKDHIMVVLRHMQRYFSYICDGTNMKADWRRNCTYGRAPNAIDGRCYTGTDPTLWLPLAVSLVFFFLFAKRYGSTCVRLASHLTVKLDL